MIEPTDQPDGAADPGQVAGAGELDLDAIERDLDDVQTALGRLDDGTYWTDEITGESIPDDVLENDPAARRAT